VCDERTAGSAASGHLLVGRAGRSGYLAAPALGGSIPVLARYASAPDEGFFLASPGSTT